MSRRPLEPNWKEWLRRWDRQQEDFNPDRERRFEVMFDVLGAFLPKRFTALDLGSGPGSLTVRLLRRFPRARSVAVDFDPVVLRVGQGALGSLGGRITWIDADLRRDDWTERLPGRRFDAAISTTALHWLGPAELRRLYRDLARLLRPRGVFLNGDYFPWAAARPSLRRLTGKVREVRTHGKVPPSGWTGWRQWWAQMEKEPALRPAFRERKLRSSRHPHGESPSLEVHAQALRLAGFREVEVIWQDFENRILLGIR